MFILAHQVWFLGVLGQLRGLGPAVPPHAQPQSGLGSISLCHSWTWLCGTLSPALCFPCCSSPAWTPLCQTFPGKRNQCHQNGKFRWHQECGGCGWGSRAITLQEEENFPPCPKIPKDSSPGETELLGLLDNSRAVAAKERSSASGRSQFQGQIPVPRRYPSSKEISQLQGQIPVSLSPSSFPLPHAPSGKPGMQQNSRRIFGISDFFFIPRLLTVSL